VVSRKDVVLPVVTKADDFSVRISVVMAMSGIYMMVG